MADGVDEQVYHLDCDRREDATELCGEKLEGGGDGDGGGKSILRPFASPTPALMVGDRHLPGLVLDRGDVPSKLTAFFCPSSLSWR